MVRDVNKLTHEAVLKEIVRAWETLPGNRRYRLNEIQDWLLIDMKPAIDMARNVLKQTKNKT